MRLKATRKRLGDGLTSLRLEGEFTINTVRKLKELFMQHLDVGEGLKVDLAGITSFDSAGYQLLEHAGMEAQKRSSRLLIGGMSTEVLRLYTLYGKQPC